MEECYSIKKMMRLMTQKVGETTDLISDEEALSFLGYILNADRIYVTGAGRSGLIAKTFAMRLMHTGLDAYVVGETITPAMKADDTLVVFSGSGETHSIVEIAETAKSIGGIICLITGNRDSHIAQMSDCIVELKTEDANSKTGNRNGNEVNNIPKDFEVRQLTGEYKSMVNSFAPLGTLFETMAMIFADAIISGIIESTHCRIEELRDRLSNIE